MPIVHDPHSGKFMPGAHAKGGGGGGGGTTNPALEHPDSQAANEASKQAHENESKEAHVNAAKAHGKAAMSHMQAGFDAHGTAAGQHQSAVEHHQAMQQEHIKAARELIAKSPTQQQTIKHIELDQRHAIKDPHSWENKHYADWQDSLSPAQSAAIFTYSTAQYQEINSHLRFNGPISKENAGHIKALDAALNSAPRTTETINVSRTISEHVVRDLNLQVGGILQDKGFMSTTMKTEAVMPGAAFINIKIPPNSKGAPISNLAAHRSEAEFLLPRNSRLKITQMGVDKKGRTAIEAELLHD